MAHRPATSASPVRQRPGPSAGPPPGGHGRHGAGRARWVRGIAGRPETPIMRFVQIVVRRQIGIADRPVVRPRHRGFGSGKSTGETGEMRAPHSVLPPTPLNRNGLIAASASSTDSPKDVPGYWDWGGCCVWRASSHSGESEGASSGRTHPPRSSTVLLQAALASRQAAAAAAGPRAHDEPHQSIRFLPRQPGHSARPGPAPAGQHLPSARQGAMACGQRRPDSSLPANRGARGFRPEAFPQSAWSTRRRIGIGEEMEPPGAPG